MAINNRSLTIQLKKETQIPSSVVRLSHSVTKKVSTAVLDENGHPTDLIQEVEIRSSILEPMTPPIDQSLSADDLRMECLIESGLVQNMNLPTFITANTPEEQIAIADNLFNNLVTELQKTKKPLTEEKPATPTVEPTEKPESINFN